MKTAGIICEYNPFHIGHLNHISQTKNALGGDAYIVCVMSGNYVQRGDFAVINKHARAKMAVLCGADLVIELPAPYALSSAREFAKAGVHLINSLGACGYLSFGSESGNLNLLQKAAHIIETDEAQAYIKEYLDMGLSYAAAQQKAAEALLGDEAAVFTSPNNILAIEYIKALHYQGSKIKAMTVKRTGGRHDGGKGLSASFIRKKLTAGTVPLAQMPGASVAVCMEELLLGRGPVHMRNMEQAIMSRIRLLTDFTDISGATDGLGRRFTRCIPGSPSVSALLSDVKTKRFAMSRIRRVLMCALLDIKNDDIAKPPPYIRVLAMNRRGTQILKSAISNAGLPIITKPASIRGQDERANRIFKIESLASDFYCLAYANEQDRKGGSEWRTSPFVAE